MFNRVKFIINKNLLQISKNKENFVKNKKIYSNNYNNKISNNFTSVGIRKFSSFKSSNEPNDPFNVWIIIASITCGSFFLFKKK
jgi:hypothetical protein